LLYSVSCRKVGEFRTAYDGEPKWLVSSGSAFCAVVLAKNGTQDNQESAKSNQVDGRTALAGILQKDYPDPISRFDEERDRKSQEQSVIGAAPKLEEVKCCCEGQSANDTQEKGLKPHFSPSQIRPYTRISIAMAALVNRQR